MGKRVQPRERIMQISIGFNFRQMEFFNKYTDFKPDKFCRKVIDEQITQIDPLFLSEEEGEKTEFAPTSVGESFVVNKNNEKKT